jgi:hypothetical protein
MNIYSIFYSISREIVQPLDQVEVMMSHIYVTFYLLYIYTAAVFLGLALNLPPAVNCIHVRSSYSALIMGYH